MDIAIIDADLHWRKRHRFPNLACMKLSAYYKSTGNNVILEKNYSNLHNYDKILISCNIKFQYLLSFQNTFSSASSF